MSKRLRCYRNKPQQHSIFSAQICLLPCLWSLRALVLLGAHRQFICSYGFSDIPLAEFLWDTIKNRQVFLDYNQKQAMIQLRQLHAEAERNLANVIAVPSMLTHNINRLSSLVTLTATECKILEFAALLHNEHFLEEAMNCLGDLTSAQTFHALSVILDLPMCQVTTALSHQGTLRKTGLITFDHDGGCSMKARLDFPTHDFGGLILSSNDDPICWLRDMVAPATPAKLSLNDYNHVEEFLAILQPYFSQAVASGRIGVNVLIHGEPGTGKTQLAKVLAQTLSCQLFEITNQDEQGNPIDGGQRLRAHRTAQGFFSARRVIFVFDEMDDVFNDPGFSRHNSAQNYKSWINNMLEENMIPTIWLSNNIENMDPAFIRRYDMVFELTTPSKIQREKILKDACGDMLDFDQLKYLASSEKLTPAVISRAVSVVQSIHQELGILKAEKAVEQIISNTLQFQGHQIPKKNDPNQLSKLYDPSYVNTNVDLIQIAKGLAHTRTGRICLFGPSGTGKTASGHWIADQLGRPLLVKRTSDLLSKYVGETEKNIAQIFREAERDQAILMLDEMDSFLYDRRSAIRSWEITQCNEMLTQMESFSGIFIASTNLLDGFDPAALRRLDIKVRFDYLAPDQRKRLFNEHCQQLNLGFPTADDLYQIGQIRNLTPGDFAVLSRQHRFYSLSNCSYLVQAIKVECALKEGAGNPMRFV